MTRLRLTTRLNLAGFLLALLLAAGCDSQTAGTLDEAGASADALTADERAVLAAHGVATSAAAAAGTPAFTISQTDVLTFEDGARVGASRMVRFDGGVLATVRTSGLEPGTATSLWMVVFNAPEHCSDGACGEDDFENPAVRLDLVWVDGQVIDPSGRAQYLAFKREGDTAGSIADPLLGAPAYGVEDAHATEIHYVVRSHGPVLPGLAYEMTHTFNGGCLQGDLPDDPRLGPAGPNTCTDVQFAVHLP